MNCNDDAYSQISEEIVALGVGGDEYTILCILYGTIEDKQLLTVVMNDENEEFDV